MLTPAYRILWYRDFPCLLCLVCNHLSHHANDVREVYCGHCHIFLRDLPALLQCDNTDGRSPGLLLTGHDPEETP